MDIYPGQYCTLDSYTICESILSMFSFAICSCCSRATIFVSLASTIVTFGALGPAQFQGMILVLNVALQNAMACKVFRILKLDVCPPPSLPPLNIGEASTMDFAGSNSDLPMSRVHKQTDLEPVSGAFTVRSIQVSVGQESNVVVDHIHTQSFAHTSMV